MKSALFSCDKKVAVVTGAAGLLGQRFCSALLESGARVAALDLVPTTLPSTSQLQSFVCDVTRKDSLISTLKKIQETFGETPNILVNNAAIDSPPNAPAEENGPFESYPEASLEKITRVNLFGPLFCCQVFGGEMARQKGGSIINMASIYGMLSPQQAIYNYKRKDGQDWYKPVTYSVTKAAVLNLTRYLATYWGRQGVRVNSLSPAGVENGQDANFLESYLPRVPMGRMAKKDELNGALIFLASEASSYMTGANLVVDGGWTAW